RLHEADVPLLNQVEKLQSAVGVLLGDRDDEPEVRLDELRLGLLGGALALADRAVGVANLADVDLQLLFDLLQSLFGALPGGVELEQLGTRDAELLGQPALGLGVVFDVAQVALELFFGGAGALLELGGPRFGALDLLDERLQLQDDLVDRLLVEPHLLQRLY